MIISMGRFGACGKVKDDEYILTTIAELKEIQEMITLSIIAVIIGINGTLAIHWELV